MQKKAKSIPVNVLPAESDGIFMSKISLESLPSSNELEQSHRDDWHLFLLQEAGTTTIEIDFLTYQLPPSSVIYIYPNQVHRLIAFNHVTLFSLALNNEVLKPRYFELLQEIAPLKTLLLPEDEFSAMSQAASLCVKLAELRRDKLYTSFLQDSCNTFIGLVVSQYLLQSTSTGVPPRYEIVTKAFKSALERDFLTVKSAIGYAKNLNVSTPYLNECVKNTTGHSVSHHIQQRIILEAKRLLYHSSKSVKEIAFELGYDDYSYFIRLFVKVIGMTPITFRAKNLE